MSTSKVVYRNSVGCCICGTKSSSSRFTSSRRYEDTFEKCFLVSSRERSGWICNSCVLIVKRFRKNPRKPSGVRDWSHKLDSKVGPGTKPKGVAGMVGSYCGSPLSGHVGGGLRRSVGGKRSKGTRRQGGGEVKTKISTSRNFMNNNNDDDDDDLTESGEDEASIPVGGQTDDGRKDDKMERSIVGSRKRKSYKIKRFRLGKPQGPDPYIDLRYYKRLSTCCGLMYIGRYRDLLIPWESYRPCNKHQKLSSTPTLTLSTLTTPCISHTPSCPPTPPIAAPPSTQPPLVSQPPVVSPSQDVTLLLSRVSDCLSSLSSSPLPLSLRTQLYSTAALSTPPPEISDLTFPTAHASTSLQSAATAIEFADICSGEPARPGKNSMDRTAVYKVVGGLGAEDVRDSPPQSVESPTSEELGDEEEEEE